MAEPGIEEGCCHHRVAVWRPTEPVRFSGAVNVAGATGVAKIGLVAAPVPTAFTAETRNEYRVPFVRPVTFAVLVAEADRARTDHAVLLLNAYSIL